MECICFPLCSSPPRVYTRSRGQYHNHNHISRNVLALFLLPLFFLYFTKCVLMNNPTHNNTNKSNNASGALTKPGVFFFKYHLLNLLLSLLFYSSLPPSLPPPSSSTVFDTRKETRDQSIPQIAVSAIAVRRCRLTSG